MPERVDFRPDRADFLSEMADSRPVRADSRPERADFRPEKADIRPDKADFRPDRADFRPEMAWGTNERTDGRTDERTKVHLCSIGLRPLWRRCPKSNIKVKDTRTLTNVNGQKKKGQRRKTNR